MSKTLTERIEANRAIARKWREAADGHARAARHAEGCRVEALQLAANAEARAEALERIAERTAKAKALR
jgi:hypothetical protein